MIFAGVAYAAGFEAGDDFIAHFERFAGIVGFDVFAEFYDDTRALVTQLDGNIAERIALVFVHVGAADAAALDFDENFVVIDLGDLLFDDLDLLRARKDGNFRLGGNVKLRHKNVPPLFVLFFE